MIPDADEIRGMGQTDDSAWFEKAREHIASELRQGAQRLQRGERLVIVPPLIRDMGDFVRKWDEHCVTLASELRGKGYQANVLPDNTIQVMLPRLPVME